MDSETQKPMFRAHCLDEMTLDPEQIRRLHDEGVARAVRYAFEHSPFYRDLARRERLRPEEIRTTGDLAAVPFTCKHDLGAGESLLRCVPEERIVDVSTTSGTTGVPTLYAMTESDVRRLGLNECLSFRCAGLTPADRVILAVTLDRCFIAGLAYFEGLRQLGASVLRVGAASPPMILNLIERVGATAIVSVPSFLKKIGLFAAERGIDLAGGPVGRLVCIGEPIREQDFTLNPLGRQIGEMWDAAVHSTYASTEMATSFCECGLGRGGHAHPELLYAEIVNEAGERVPDGTVGEVVVTTFGVEAMPLVRFRTGDCAFLTTARCECGRWTPRLGPICGRKDQIMKIKGTTVFPAAVQRVLDGLDAVLEYVMIVTAPSPLSDELEVVVAVSRDVDALPRVRAELQGALKVTPAVRVAALEEIERLQDSARLRKKKRFIDRRHAE